MCPHRFLDLPDGLRCSREDHPERPGDHVYQASSVGDAHDASEDAAERGRG